MVLRCDIPLTINEKSTLQIIAGRVVKAASEGRDTTGGPGMTQKRRWALSEDARARLTLWNLNTVVGLLSVLGSVGALLAIVFGWGGQFNENRRNFAEIAEWQADWQDQSKDRRGEIERQFGASGSRDSAQDDALRKNSELSNQNAFRIAGLEARGERLERSLDDLAKQLNEQSGDLKVIKEILTRLEAGQKPRDK